MTSETFCISVVLLDIYIQSCSALLLNLNTASSSPPGSRAVLHGHVAAEDPPGGAGPGAHASWEGSHRRRPQPQLWPAAGVRPGRQAAPGQLWSRRYVWGVCGSHVINLKKKEKRYDVSFLLASSGGRNLPRSLLGSSTAGDSEGGVFAVPTTLPPNSSRHNKMFSPNKEAELALRQQLDSISVSHIIVLSSTGRRAVLITLVPLLI